MAAAFRVNSTRAWLIARGIGARWPASGAVAQDAAPPDDQPARQQHASRCSCRKIRRCSARRCLRSSRRRRSSTATSSPRPTSTSASRCLAIANGGQIPADEVERLRQQVLRNLIDETLEIQAAKTEKIEIKQSDIDKTVARVAGNVEADARPARRLPRSQRLDRSASLRRQIEGEIAWQRLQRAKIESGVSVGDDEVKAVLDKHDRFEGHRGISRRRDLPVGDPGDRGADARQCQQDPRAAAQRRVVRRLRAAIFGSLDGGGRRRPRLGPPGAAPGAARRPRCGRWPPGTDQQPDPGARRRLDHRGAGHPQDPDGRSRAMRCSA